MIRQPAPFACRQDDGNGRLAFRLYLRSNCFHLRYASFGKGIHDLHRQILSRRCNETCPLPDRREGAKWCPVGFAEVAASLSQQQGCCKETFRGQSIPHIDVCVQRSPCNKGDGAGSTAIGTHTATLAEEFCQSSVHGPVVELAGDKGVLDSMNS